MSAEPQDPVKEEGVQQAATPITHLRDEEGVKLLDTIDKLRSLDIDQDIPLPQIVVVGEQDAGKSSVLEAISGIPFPTSHGACTRFATEVVLRRSPVKATKATLLDHAGEREPSGSSSAARKRTNMSKAFEAAIKLLEPLTTNDIPRIIQEATNAMGLDQANGFSDQVLRLEVKGPDQDHLTLIDLPGFIGYAGAGKATSAPTLIRNLAMHYMKQSRSIVLAVIHGRTDYFAQDTLALLEEVDPHGLRTIGVITALDKLQEATDQKFLALARNEDRHLRLGWHCLRNPDVHDRKMDGYKRSTFAKEMEFFSQEPWSLLPPADWGAAALRQKLSRMLMNHIGQELGQVIDAIDNKIRQCEASLDRIGPEPKDKRMYLSRLADRHQRLVRDGVDGSYGGDFFDERSHRLRADLRAEFEHFEEAMSNAHHLDFWSKPGTRYSPPNEDRHLVLKPSQGSLPMTVSREDYLYLIDECLHQWRGRNLRGTFEPLLVGKLFCDQSSRWEGRATSLFGQVYRLVKDFLYEVTWEVADDHRAKLIYEQHIKPLLDERDKAMALKLKELLKVYRGKPPATCNPEFVRRRDSIKRKHYKTQGLSSTHNHFNDHLRDRSSCEDLAAHVESYYEIARATFVDNVVNLCVELCMLDDLDYIMSPLAVMEMSSEKVEALAAELEESVYIRSATTRALKRLRAGRAICQGHERAPAAEPRSRRLTDIKHTSGEDFQKPGTPQPATDGRARTRSDSATWSPESTRSSKYSAHSRSIPSTAQTTPEKVPLSPVEKAFQRASMGDDDIPVQDNDTPTRRTKTKRRSRQSVAVEDEEDL